MTDFWQTVGGILVVVGWYIIIFYYVPYPITLAIRRAKAKTPQHVENNYTLTLHTKDKV